MTSQGSAHGRFSRAIERRNLFQVELALREVGASSLLVALDYRGVHSIRTLQPCKPGDLTPLNLVQPL